MSSTTTQEILRNEWKAYFDAFSREHENWMVTVEVIAPDIGAQVQAEEVRLKGISAELKDGENAIAIILGKRLDEHITHVISEPARVMLECSELDSGSFETLAIESEDGTKTLVRLLAGVVPGSSAEG